jgi:hypothetical protein
MDYVKVEWYYELVSNPKENGLVFEIVLCASFCLTSGIRIFEMDS